MNKGGYVYIMASVSTRVLYVDVTSDIIKRVWQHKNKVYPTGFTSRYNCITLVYYKEFGSIELAIQEEKRIKGGSREDKEVLINSMNPEWVTCMTVSLNWIRLLRRYTPRNDAHNTHPSLRLRGTKQEAI